MQQLERWLAVPGYEGRYECSDAGRVRTVARTVKCARATRHRPSVLIHQAMVQRGKALYAQVCLWIGHKSRTITVHQLVLLTFVGPRPPGMCGCHRDGNSLNNRLENLRWDTFKANAADRAAHGRTRRGPVNKVPQAIELEIAASKESARALAHRFGISNSCIKRIRAQEAQRA
jgi:hypothetical protein